MKKTIYLLIVLTALSLSLAGNNDEVLKPGDNLVVEGIPAIPAALADAVAIYNNFRYASFQGWHPLQRDMIIPALTRPGAISSYSPRISAATKISRCSATISPAAKPPC
jgi:hypothetical protein